MDLLSGRIDAVRLRRILAEVYQIAGIDHWWLCWPPGNVAATSMLESAEVAPGFVVTCPALLRFGELVVEFDV